MVKHPKYNMIEKAITKMLLSGSKLQDLIVIISTDTYNNLMKEAFSQYTDMTTYKLVTVKDVIIKVDDSIKNNYCYVIDKTRCLE